MASIGPRWRWIPFDGATGCQLPGWSQVFGSTGLRLEKDGESIGLLWDTDGGDWRWKRVEVGKPPRYGGAPRRDDAVRALVESLGESDGAVAAITALLAIVADGVESSAHEADRADGRSSAVRRRIRSHPTSLGQGGRVMGEWFDDVDAKPDPDPDERPSKYRWISRPEERLAGLVFAVLGGVCFWSALDTSFVDTCLLVLGVRLSQRLPSRGGRR